MVQLNPLGMHQLPGNERIRHQRKGGDVKYLTGCQLITQDKEEIIPINTMVSAKETKFINSCTFLDKKVTKFDYLFSHRI